MAGRGLVGVVILRQVLNAMPLVYFISGLSVFRATASDQGSTLMSMIAPPRSDTVFRIVVMRTWDIEVGRAAAGSTCNILVFYLARWISPLVGVLVLISVSFDATYAVEWPADTRRPRTRQLHNLVGSGALGGAFCGMLFGLLFLTPMLGAATGALMGSLRDVGIDDNFIDKVKSSVAQGTSALFVLSSDVVQDKVSAAFDGVNAELVHTNLSANDEQKLRAAFLEEEPVEGKPLAK